MKTKEIDWTYVDEFRRYKGNRHQLYFEGTWIDIKLGFNNDLD
jgi:hypothetical protein